MCARLTWLFIEVSTHAHCHAHARTEAHVKTLDGDQCKPYSVFSPPHRELNLYDNKLVTLPDTVFGGLSALRSVDIQSLSYFNMNDIEKQYFMLYI